MRYKVPIKANDDYITEQQSMARQTEHDHKPQNTKKEPHKQEFTHNTHMYTTVQKASTQMYIQVS